MSDLEPVPASFCPFLRFCICSDLHIKEAGDDHTQRLRQLMETTYALAQAHPAYKNVDAFLFAGDLTNTGTPAQFHAFWDTVQSALQPETRAAKKPACGISGRSPGFRPTRTWRSAGCISSPFPRAKRTATTTESKSAG